VGSSPWVPFVTHGKIVGLGFFYKATFKSIWMCLVVTPLEIFFCYATNQKHLNIFQLLFLKLKNPYMAS